MNEEFEELEREKKKLWENEGVVAFIDIKELKLYTIGNKGEKSYIDKK